MSLVEALIGAVTIESIDAFLSRRRLIWDPLPSPRTGGDQKEEVNMAYGLDPRLFLENGPANHAATVHARSSSNAFRAWSGLDADRRLALVERVLRPAANDSADLPIAL